MDRTLYIIADPHLGTIEGDIDIVIRFLTSIVASESEVIFLGDLFHVWVGPPKYHTSQMKRLFAGIIEFRSAGGKARLIAGNRDTLLPEMVEGKEKKGLPFNSISREFLTLQQNNGLVVAFHGDTVNQKDTTYLRWRRMIRHPLFEFLFKLLPFVVVNRLIVKLERELKQTNMKFKRVFPAEEWEHFAQRCESELSPDLLVVGHFHPDTPVIYEGESMTGVVIPDWHKNQSYMIVHPDMSRQIRQFEP